jgi:hypothetical protein
LRLEGVVAVKGLPSKKVLWISAGASLGVAAGFAAGGFAADGAAGGAAGGAARTDTVSSILEAATAKIVRAETCSTKHFAIRTFRSETRAAIARMVSLL